MYLLGIISLALITMPLTVAGLSSMKKETLSTIQIRLRNGQILKGNRNLITETQNEQNQYIVYEFLSVPFAQAPLNEKRFQFPFKLDTLLTNDLYDATKFKDSCVQELDTTFPGFSGSEMWNAPGGISEDCLYMNIWVPVKKDQDQLLKTESSKSYPEYISNGFSLNSEDKATLFWIYGGSFSSGSVNLNVYDGNLLAGLENVILVSPNYRLGPFGFLYLNSEKAPGNAGLADITLALEWFRNNYLEFFGGSLNKICLFGESAGAMNIHNLLLSDKRNLFNRAILESSSSYLESSYRNKESALKLTIHFAEKVGCLPKTDNNKNISKLNSLKIEQNRLTLENTYNEKVLKCLLKQNASYLSQKQWEIEYVNEYLKMQFVPTSDYNNLFTLDPFDFDFKTNRFINHDVLAGVNENEGTYFLFYYYNNRYFNLTGFYNQTSTTQYNNAFVTERLIETLTTKYSIKNDDAYFKEYAQCLSSAYTVNTGFNFDLNTELNRNKNSPELAFVKLSKILGDVVFSCPTIKFANKYSESMPDKTYFYKFSQRAKANPWPQWLGVIHAQEIEYIFGLPLRNSTLYDDDDRLTSRNIMSYWANFARFGKLFSRFDPIQNRELFVDFTVQSNKLNSQPTEQDQLDSFKKLHMNCDLINQLEPFQTYKNKLKLCKKYHESFGKYFNSASFTSKKHIYSITYFFNHFFLIYMIYLF